MNSKKLFLATSAVAMAACSATAMAQSSASTTAKIKNSQPGSNPGLQAGVLTVTTANNAANLAGAIGSIALGGNGVVAGGLNMKRFALANNGKTGAAAAPGGSPWNVWGAASRSNVAYNFTPLQSSGKVEVFLAGVDYTLDNNMVIGLAVARDDSDIDLTFSGGKLSGKGYTFSPYLGVPINKNLAFDATLGFGRSDIDTQVTGNGVAITGRTKNDRTIGTLGLTYRENIGALTLSARGAYINVNDKLGAYVLSNRTLVADGKVDLSQVRLTGQAAYTIDAFTPYVSLTYVNDIKRPDQAAMQVNSSGSFISAANDRDAWTVGLGFRFMIDRSVYGGFQYSKENGRSEVKNENYQFNVGARF